MTVKYFLCNCLLAFFCYLPIAKNEKPVIMGTVSLQYYIPEASEGNFVISYYQGERTYFPLKKLQRIQQMCFTNNFNATSSLYNYGFRLRQPYEIIVIESSVYELEYSSITKIFNHQLFSERSIFWILSLSRSSPASNLLLEYKESKNVIGATCLILGVRDIYLSDNVSHNVPNLTTELFEKPSSLHRRLRWNSQSRHITALLLVRIDAPFYFREHPGDNFVCFKLVLKSKSAYYCNSELMTAISVSKVHNISLQLKDRTNATELAAFWKSESSQEYILTYSVGLHSENGTEAITDNSVAKMFSSAQSMVPIYCKYSGVQSQANITTSKLFWSGWLSMFQKDMWLVTIIVFVVFSILSNIRPSIDKRKVWDSGAIFSILSSSLSRQPIGDHNLKSTSFVVLLVLGMSVCILFENSIVSVVVSPPKPEVFKSLRAALTAGYKIVWDPAGNEGIPFESFFSWDFKLLGIYDLIESSYMSINWETFTASTRPIDEKAIFPAYNVNLDINIAVLLRRIQTAIGKTGVVKCLTVPETLHNHFDIWKVQSRNRNWILQSIAHLEESGLPEKWDEWANAAYLRIFRSSDVLTSETINIQKVNVNSVINFPKVIGVLILWAIVNVVAAIIFMFENRQRTIIFLASIMHNCGHMEV